MPAFLLRKKKEILRNSYKTKKLLKKQLTVYYVL